MTKPKAGPAKPPKDTTDPDPSPPPDDPIEAADTYVGMFAEYVESLGEIEPADRPLIFHARKICQQLDKQIAKDGATLAAKDGAYLQAVERLNKRLSGPAPVPPGGPQVPGQTGIFDYLED